MDTMIRPFQKLMYLFGFLLFINVLVSIFIGTPFIVEAVGVFLVVALILTALFQSWMDEFNGENEHFTSDEE